MTNSLTDLLRSGSDPQILNIALPSEKLRIDFDDIQSLKRFKPMTNLLKTKLCLFLYSLELANRIKDSGIKVITGIPNNRPFKSNLGREMLFFTAMLMKLISVEIEQIATTVPYVLSQENLKTGYVFKGQKHVSLSPYWQNTDIRSRLWEETELLLAFG